MADKETQPQVVGAAQTDVAVLTPPITDVLTEEAPILEAVRYHLDSRNFCVDA